MDTPAASPNIIYLNILVTDNAKLSQDDVTARVQKALYDAGLTTTMVAVRNIPTMEEHDNIVAWFMKAHSPGVGNIPS